MKFTITINQVRALEWGLSFQQAGLFAFLYECPSWSNPVKTDDGIFFAVSKAKIIEEVPLLTDKPDTIYRILKSLVAAGVIDLSSTPKITLFRLTDKGKTWNKKTDGSEIYPTPSENTENKGVSTSEKNLTYLGKKSEQGSEKSPTNKDTSNKVTSNKSGATAAPRKSTKFDPVDVKPENVSAQAWSDWCQHRREIRKPLTAKTCEQQAKALEAHQTPDAVINLSISNGWTGLFPEKVLPTTKGAPSRHNGFAERNYEAGLTAREGGGYAF